MTMIDNNWNAGMQSNALDEDSTTRIFNGYKKELYSAYDKKELYGGYGH